MKRRDNPLSMALCIITIFLLVSVSLNITKNLQINELKEQTEQLIKEGREQTKNYEHLDSAITALNAEITEIRKQLNK